MNFVVFSCDVLQHHFYLLFMLKLYGYVPESYLFLHIPLFFSKQKPREQLNATRRAYTMCHGIEINEQKYLIDDRINKYKIFLPDILLRKECEFILVCYLKIKQVDDTSEKFKQCFHVE